MYFREGQVTGFGDGRDPVILRPSQRFFYTARPTVFPSFTHNGSVSPYYGLGEPPKGLKLLDHFHVPKKPDQKTPGQFITGSISKLVTSDMNPGFTDASDNLIKDTSQTGLQTCLEKLITSEFHNYLSSPSNTAPDAKDRLRVALVDLTGNKISQPDFAGWGETLAMSGASVPKVLVVFAAHQLRSDLRNLATTNSISSAKDLEKEASKSFKKLSRGSRPNLGGLFGIRKWKGDPNLLDFTADTKKALEGIRHNPQAKQIILDIGFPYIASLTFQSGLFHPTRGGMWLTTSYNGETGSNPVKAKFQTNVTALSVATFFTLLAQGRLVDDAGSTDIKNILSDGCITSHFPITNGIVASKCGFTKRVYHDSVLIDRADARYVVVGLTATKSSELGKYTQLFNKLDQLIVQNNKSKKTAC